MPYIRTATVDTLDAAIDLDAPFRVTSTLDADGVATLATDESTPWSPDVYVDTLDDEVGSVAPGAVEVMLADLARHGWHPVGTSSQQGGGPVMHTSEALSGSGLARRILTDGGTWAACEVRGMGPAELDAEPIGWILLHMGEVTA